MVVAWSITVAVALIVGVLIGSFFSKRCEFRELVILVKENRQLKEELEKKIKEIQYWEATPETTTTKKIGRES